MFTNLTQRLSDLSQRLSGRGQLSEKHIDEAVREVRMALLEADVALSVVKPFIEDIKTQALGERVQKGVRPGDQFIAMVQRALEKALGDETATLALDGTPPVCVLMAGLQGAGKTTTVGKLARWLTSPRPGQSVYKVGVASVDISRPAALLQLETLAEQASVPVYVAEPTISVAARTQDIMSWARKQGLDVLLLDTAGRQHVDDALMAEIKDVHAIAQPQETLFVVDSMMGQDAVNAAKSFSDALPLTGVVLTKTDGDARGGAALSVKHVTGCPIKFMGTGEQLDGLDVFHPKRVAQRLLGMGDVASLVEQAAQHVDEKKAKRLNKKMAKGRLDLEDLKQQLETMQNMGGLGSMLDKLPGMGKMKQAVAGQIEDGAIARQIAIINSMTQEERRFPAKLNGSRKRRIAAGSGNDVPAVNRLLKQYKQMQTMMKRMKKGGMKNMMRNMPPMQ